MRTRAPSPVRLRTQHRERAEHAALCGASPARREQRAQRGGAPRSARALTGRSGRRHARGGKERRRPFTQSEPKHEENRETRRVGARPPSPGAELSGPSSPTLRRRQATKPGGKREAGGGRRAGGGPLPLALYGPPCFAAPKMAAPRVQWARSGRRRRAAGGGRGQAARPPRDPAARGRAGRWQRGAGAEGVTRPQRERERASERGGLVGGRLGRVTGESSRRRGPPGALEGNVGPLAEARLPRRRRAAGSGLGRPPLEPGGVRGREDRGVPDVLHEPALPAERRAQQHRHAGPQAGGHQTPAARHRPVSTRPAGERLPAAPPAGGPGGAEASAPASPVEPAGGPQGACQNLGEVLGGFVSCRELRLGSVVGIASWALGPVGGGGSVPEGGCGGAWETLPWARTRGKCFSTFGSNFKVGWWNAGKRRIKEQRVWTLKLPLQL